MSEQRYDVVDAAEDASKVGYSCGVFVLRAFYKVSGLESLKKSHDYYAISRFAQTIEYFQYEQDKIDIEQKKEFYEDLKYNEQNLAYLYSLFSKSRESTFLIHMRILAKLSAKLVANKGLNYIESIILSNINLLNEEDFKLMYNFLKKENVSLRLVDETTSIKKSEKVLFKINSIKEKMVFDKCIQLGIVTVQNSFGFGDDEILLYTDRPCYFTRYTLEFYQILDDVIAEHL